MVESFLQEFNQHFFGSLFSKDKNLIRIKLQICELKRGLRPVFPGGKNASVEPQLRPMDGIGLSGPTCFNGFDFLHQWSQSFDDAIDPAHQPQFYVSPDNR